jgi:hypothetical protein
LSGSSERPKLANDLAQAKQYRLACWAHTAASSADVSAAVSAADLPAALDLAGWGVLAAMESHERTPHWPTKLKTKAERYHTQKNGKLKTQNKVCAKLCLHATFVSQGCVCKDSTRMRNRFVMKVSEFSR